MVSLELKKCVTLVVSNHWYRDYPEDDWKIKIYSTSEEEAVSDFWQNKFVGSGINISNVGLFDTLYVEYEGTIHVIKKTKIECNATKLLNDSPFKVLALAKEKEFQTKKKEKEEKRYLAIEASKERAEYERLKNKFEH